MGLPKVITTDNGTEFLNELNKHLIPQGMGHVNGLQLEWDVQNWFDKSHKEQYMVHKLYHNA